MDVNLEMRKKIARSRWRGLPVHHSSPTGHHQAIYSIVALYGESV
jgi:hypothetical protein